MKIQGMRWGYDGGGFACGPMPGTCYVEVAFFDGNQTLYLTDGLFECFEHFWLTEESYFDKLMSKNWDPEDIKSIYETDFESGRPIDDDIWDEISEMGIYDDWRFVRHMMDRFTLEDDDETAKTAIQPYIGKNTKDLEIPDYKWDDDEDEEDDEDYENEEDDEDDESDEDE